MISRLKESNKLSWCGTMPVWFDGIDVQTLIVLPKKLIKHPDTYSLQRIIFAKSQAFIFETDVKNNWALKLSDCFLILLYQNICTQYYATRQHSVTFLCQHRTGTGKLGSFFFQLFPFHNNWSVAWSRSGGYRLALGTSDNPSYSQKIWWAHQRLEGNRAALYHY